MLFRSDVLVSELSQGTRQKLSLIIALLCKPKVLCLDEPTNGLDVIAKKQFAKLLLTLSQEKGTIVLMITYISILQKKYQQVFVSCVAGE